MEYKDYYAILGVSPDADEQEIKRAYRRLAREHHPDFNPGNAQAEETFKEINEAYQALSDPERRRKYDELRQQYNRWQQGDGRDTFDWNQWQAGPGQQTYTYNVSPEDLEDLFGDASPFSDFFTSMYGRTAGGSTRRPRAARARRGRDLEATVEVTLEEAFHGTTRTIEIGDRRIEVRIPPGVGDGSRIRFRGQGSPGAGGGPAGDLYLNVQVLPHPVFERDGDDLHTGVPVDFYTAALGGEVRVPTIDGAVMLKIPPRTQADRVFRLRGKGMPRRDRPDERGDLYARIKLVLPEPLSDRELEALERLARPRQKER